MMLDAETTTMDHLERFSPKETGFNVKEGLNFSMKYPALRPMMSFVSGDEVVFICGLSFISEGVWEAWLIPSINIHKYAIQVVRTMKDFTDWLFSSFPVHRIQMAVLKEHFKWAQKIGFELESIVKNYHNKLDHYMFIKVSQ